MATLLWRNAGDPLREDFGCTTSRGAVVGAPQRPLVVVERCQ